ncbi:hypothetical protein KO481_39360 [Nocardia sp. NEAU-G5]|uniref:Transposase n=1 Tax=Nocardia albiluteola TaxID=2842303 RepID=A0ABS6BBA4_9NOCA|nr:hypothetical protein [Nocardia albiluteola]MBU3067567.1 hypothetical protein [Nocardia albiluteola]
MSSDLDTLLTALYVKIDDELTGPRWTGRPPILTDSELICLAVAQSLPWQIERALRDVRYTATCGRIQTSPPAE